MEEDLDLIEANEAFAAQSLAVGKELQWDLNKVLQMGNANNSVTQLERRGPEV